MRVLAVDIGGTTVKFLAKGQKVPRSFPSGRTLTPKQMVAGIEAQAADWQYNVVAIGYPGRVQDGRIVVEPRNLAPGWIGFDFTAAFGRPVRIINDAAMQALGSYKHGLLLFLGLGTGVGAALVANGIVVPMELAHLPFKSGTYEEYLGVQALRRLGRKKWQKHVEFAAARIIDVFRPDDVVLGRGNAQKLKKLLAGCRYGDNSFAFTGGYRLWENESKRPKPAKAIPARQRRAKAPRVKALRTGALAAAADPTRVVMRANSSSEWLNDKGHRHFCWKGATD